MTNLIKVNDLIFYIILTATEKNLSHCTPNTLGELPTGSTENDQESLPLKPQNSGNFEFQSSGHRGINQNQQCTPVTSTFSNNKAASNGIFGSSSSSSTKIGSKRGREEATRHHSKNSRAEELSFDMIKENLNRLELSINSGHVAIEQENNNLNVLSLEFSLQKNRFDNFTCVIKLHE